MNIAPDLDPLEVFVQAGRKDIRRSWMPPLDELMPDVNATAEKMIERALAVEDGFAAFLALSFLPPMDALKSIPKHVFQMMRAKGDRYRLGADLLELYSLNWTDEEAESKSQMIAELQKKDGRPVAEFAEFLEGQNKHGSAIESLLVRTIDGGSLSYAASLLAKVIERRPLSADILDPGNARPGAIGTPEL